MKKIAIIVMAENFSGVGFVAPVFVSVIKQVATVFSEEIIGPVTELELTGVLERLRPDENALVISTKTPFITSGECGRLFEKLNEKNRVLYAENEYDGPVVQNARDAVDALTALRKKKNEELLKKGVLLLDPERTYIDPDVTIGEGTVIHPNNTISGGSTIGKNCVLLPNSRIHASVIADGVRIESSVLTECSVMEESAIGPFAYLRPKAAVGRRCRVGDFVEIKNSSIGDDTKVSHLTYVGDSDLGQRINLGCGVVFVNYDGKKKFRSHVADDAFIGCNVNLVSPVEVGEGAYVAAGSTVTEDVPGGALVIARARQSVKEGWVEARKKEGKL